MLSTVMIGPTEVLTIVIITAIIVFILVRRKTKK
jgi:hypothetical protein